MKKKSWEEFRSTGLVLFVNFILHIFGWVLAFEIDKDEKVLSVFPARCNKFRGFNSDDIEESYKKITEYIYNNSAELLLETKNIYNKKGNAV